MKLHFVLIFFLLFQNTSAFSELIPSHNLTVAYEQNWWTKCSVASPYNLQETTLRNPDANQLVARAKQSLVYAYVLSSVQQSPVTGGNAPLYSLTGFQCTWFAADALQQAISAITTISKDIDQEVEKLDFEIGNSFAGPGADELTEAMEAQENRGQIGETIGEVQGSVKTAEIEMRNRNPLKASETASWIIKQNGAADELEAYLQRVKASQLEVKSLAESRASEAAIETDEAEKQIAELKSQEVDKIGWFELNSLLIESESGVLVDELVATSPAGLLAESETVLQKANTLKKQSTTFKTRGRSARQIEFLDNAIQHAQLSKAAATQSLEKTLNALNQLEKKALEEQELASQMTQPIGRSIALKAIRDLRTGETYFDRITSLNNLVKTLSQLRKIYSGEVEERDRLAAKVKIRQLQRVALSAERENVDGAEEINGELKKILPLIDETATHGQLLEIEEELANHQAQLFGLIEDKFGYLRQVYQDALYLNEQGILSEGEESQLKQMADTFAGKNTLTLKVDELGDIEKNLRRIIDTKRLPTINFETAPAKNITASEVLQAKTTSQPNATLQPAELTFLRQELRELTEAGTSAFYSGDRSKKTLEQLEFEQTLKTAEKISREVEKSPTQDKVKELKDNLDKMRNTIQQMQRKAATEIAIAEQNGAKATDLENAEKKWETGNYLEALQTAKKANKAVLGNQAPITANVVKSPEDPKMMAIAISVVIILIGAAYLLYVKRNEQQSP